ncbi:MAG: hypothetical protein J0H77_12870 [Alphaproteobacteria bacterium]|nr:hypothetical protein [Alphaproteobacteria bacterium]
MTAPPALLGRIRIGVIGALVLFAIAIVPIVLATLAMVGDRPNHLSLSIAAALWAVGLLFALWATLCAVRSWRDLPREVRSLAVTPLAFIALPQAVALLVLWL